MAFALATHTRDILEHPPLFEDACLADEVRVNLRQLRSRVAEANLRKVTLDSGQEKTPLSEPSEVLQSAGKRRKQKNQRREKTMELFREAVSVSAAHPAA